MRACVRIDVAVLPFTEASIYPDDDDTFVKYVLKTDPAGKAIKFVALI